MKYLLSILLLLVALPCHAQIVGGITNGLRASWSFEDLSVRDNYGVFNGSNSNWVAFVQGRFGMAGQFNGSNSYVCVGASGSTTQLLNTSSNWTWSVWIKTVSNSPGEILVSGKLGGRWNVLKMFDATHLGWVNSAGGAGTSYLTKKFGDGVWHHLLVTTTDASNYKNIYLDGAQVLTVNGSSNVNTQNPFYIGGEEAGSGYCFNGQIDAVLIYNRILTASEIATLANFKPWSQQ